MIDPFTAITAATTAYSTVVRMVKAGQEAEETFKQMGKWYTAVQDFRRGQAENKHPPLFKKLFAAGSVEEEALALLLHEKKIAEQEKDLQTLLNWRFGYKTWDELKEMRRKIQKERQDTVYKQRQRQKAFFDVLTAVGLIIVGGAILTFFFWIFLSATGRI
jgi:hypothetical protein